DAKAPNSLRANIMLGIDEAEKLFRFTARKERRIKKLGYPIHLMSVGQIKRHLHIFIGIFHNEDPVVIDVGAFEFALEKDGTTYSAVLPSSTCLRPVVPCVDVTIKSTRLSLARSQICCPA